MSSPRLPSSQEILFLRACLLSREQGGRAWAEWCAAGDVRMQVRTEHAYKPLLPLLAEALQRHGVEVEATMRPFLRAALIREEARYAEYCRVLRRVLDALRLAAVRVVILKGAALAQAVYPLPFLRHSHDIDLMVAEADVVRATRVLLAAGFTGDGHTPIVADASRLRVQLHTRPFAGAGADVVEAFWQRSEATEVAGIAARALSPLDALTQIVAQSAVASASRRLVWVCDAWLLIEPQ